jgi:hypothetical protein
MRMAEDPLVSAEVATEKNNPIGHFFRFYRLGK